MTGHAHHHALRSSALQKLHPLRITDNYFEHRLIVLSIFFKDINVRILYFQLLKCKYTNLFSLLSQLTEYFWVADKIRHLNMLSLALGNTDRHFFYRYLSFYRLNN